MLIFIDESGCPGFKLGKGSTPYFVVAMVIFHQASDAESTASTIQALKEKLKLKSEFKFNKSSNTIKDHFFEAIANCPFSVRAIVVDKSNVYSSRLRADDESFYNFFLKSLLAYDNGVLNNAAIKVDGSGDREFKQALAKYLKNNLPTGKIASFRFVDSNKNVLIQLADMVSGAIYRSYRNDSNKDTQNRWRRSLRRQLDNVWEFK